MGPRADSPDAISRDRRRFLIFANSSPAVGASALTARWKVGPGRPPGRQGLFQRPVTDHAAVRYSPSRLTATFSTWHIKSDGRSIFLRMFKALPGDGMDFGARGPHPFFHAAP